MSPNSTRKIYEALASDSGGRRKRDAIFTNIAAGITAVITGGIIVPSHQVLSSGVGRLIGTRGIASDAAHLNYDARAALLKVKK